MSSVVAPQRGRLPTIQDLIAELRQGGAFPAPARPDGSDLPDFASRFRERGFSHLPDRDADLLRTAAQIPLRAAEGTAAAVSGVAQFARDVTENPILNRIPNPLTVAAAVGSRAVEPAEAARKALQSTLPPETADEIVAGMVGRLIPFALGTGVTAASLPARIPLAARNILASTPMAAAQARSAPEQSTLGTVAALTESPRLQALADRPAVRVLAEIGVDALLGGIVEGVIRGARGARPTSVPDVPRETPSVSAPDTPTRIIREVPETPGSRPLRGPRRAGTATPGNPAELGAARREILESITGAGVGGIVGALGDDDNRTRGALAGAVLGGVAPATIRRMRTLDAAGKIRAFHGTRHDFNRFDIGKIGTGEGAQAYGHGLYFAGKRDVAEYYRQTLADFHLRAPDGTIVRPERGAVEDQALAMVEMAMVDLRASDPIGKALELARRVEPDDATPNRDAIMATLARWHQEGMELRKGGNLFEVDIDVDESRLLDFDAPIRDQSPEVLQRLAAVVGKERTGSRRFDTEPAARAWAKQFEPEEIEVVREGGSSRPWTVYIVDDPLERRGHISGGQFYREHLQGASGSGDPAEAARNLREAGIPGIRYLNGASRSAGEGDFNYVIFDDSAINIINKEAGAASREVLQSVAGAGVGAATGAAIDDEHRARGAVLGGVAGAVAPGALRGLDEVGALGTRSAVRRQVHTGGALPLRGVQGADIPVDARANPVKAFIRRQFTSRGNLPAAVHQRAITRDGGINAYLTGMQATLRQFEQEASRVYGRTVTGGSKIPDAQLRRLDLALKGQSVRGLPQTLRPIVRRMRQEIDVLSTRLKDAGAIEGDLAAIVDANLGTYATRSYRVFDDPNWAQRVPEDVRNKAKAWLRDEMLRDPDLAQLKQTDPDAFEQRFNGEFRALLERPEDGPMALLSRGGKLGSKDLSIMKRRKDIPSELRALWGEFTDPRVNYARSVTKMAHMLENHLFLKDVRAAGAGTLFFPHRIETDAGAFIKQIAADESDVMAPLNGLFTTREIEQAFRDAVAPQNAGPFLQAYMRVNGVVKYAKTVGSLMTHVRNVIGNTGFAVANGHLQVGAMRGAVRAVRASLGRDDAASLAYFQKLQRLGVVHDNANAGELRAVLADAMGHAEDPTRGLAVPPRAFKAGQVTLAAADQLGRGAGKLASGVTAVYRAEDDVWKVFAFENELARYRKALPHANLAELERHVAGIVRDTYPTYSLIPNAVQALRRVPLIGTFVSFPAEVIRTGGNTLRLAAQELQNPATKAIGAQRLAGITAAVGGISAATAAARLMTGTTMQDDKDLRRYVPPWTKNSNILHLGRKPNGDIRYIDLSYTDPYSYLRKPLMALMQGEDWETALFQAAAEASEPFLGEEILAGKLIDIARNSKKDSGSPVYNPEADFGSKAQDVMAHVWDAIEPGTISSAQRIWRGVSNNQPLYGRTYDPKLEAAAVFTGHRIATLSPANGLSWNASGFVRRRADAQRILSRVANRGGTVVDEELLTAAGESERARQAIYEEMFGDVQAAERMGLSPERIRTLLRAAGISRRDARDLMDGTYRPYEPSAQFLKRLENRATAVNPEEAQRIRDVLNRRRTLIQERDP